MAAASAAAASLLKAGGPKIEEKTPRSSRRLEGSASHGQEFRSRPADILLRWPERAMLQNGQLDFKANRAEDENKVPFEGDWDLVFSGCLFETVSPLQYAAPCSWLLLLLF